MDAATHGARTAGSATVRPVKYDDASWHYDSAAGADEEERWARASNHIAVYVKWCMLRGWVGADHLLDDEVVAAIQELRDGTLSAYAFEDAFICGKFSEQDLSDEGNAFTRYYYLSSDSAVSDAYLLREDVCDFEAIAAKFDVAYDAWVAAGRPRPPETTRWWRCCGKVSGPSPRAKRGLVATWWDATVKPSVLAASLANAEPRVHPGVYATAAIVSSAMLAAVVVHVQLSGPFADLGLTHAQRGVERVAFATNFARLGLSLVGITAAVGLFAFASKRSMREALRVRAYTLGPISNLYAWWTLYRWLREAQPGALRPGAYALMSFTVEWGLRFVLTQYFELPLREVLLGILPS